MDKYFEAVDTVRKLAKLYKGMEFAAEMLEKVGSFEQAADQAQARARTAREDELKTLAALEEAEKHVVEAGTQAKVLLDSTEEKVAAILEEATRQVQEAVAQAHVDAQALRDAATANAARMERDAALLVAEAKAQKADIDALTEQAEVKRDQAQRELAEITAKIAKAKEHITTLLAG